MIFREKDVMRISLLSRAIALELVDKNVKMKKLTKLFLNEFNSNLNTLSSLIASGAFNSIFNLITILAGKDANHFCFNADFTLLKKSLLVLKFEIELTIEETYFWCYFNRL